MMTDDIVKVIEEQADTIMRQADMIYHLSLLLLQHCGVAREEINEITGTDTVRRSVYPEEQQGTDR